MKASQAMPPPPGGRKRILSGVQPSGKLHLGNYFGAIKQHIALQDEGECFYFIADFHALTSIGDTQPDPKQRGPQIRAAVRDVALDYLALGLDPAKVAFFRQSDVPEVTELAWIFATVTGMGLMERAHSYKDKIAKGLTPMVGLFTYPILMAADILIYRSHVVPVGQDQVQHLEMTRDIAGYFNNAYGVEVFPLPKERLDRGAKVPGTDGEKMSKSYGNTIDIFAEGKPLKQAVMGIKTDSTPQDQPKDPTNNTVVTLYNLFATPEESAKLESLFRNPMEDAAARDGKPFGYGHAKTMLLDKVNGTFGPFRERRRELAARPDYVEDVLREGATKARAEAQATMDLVRSATGIR
jgi:tryptophanyl-tRNA synthetase